MSGINIIYWSKEQKKYIFSKNRILLIKYKCNILSKLLVKGLIFSMDNFTGTILIGYTYFIGSVQTPWTQILWAVKTSSASGQ